jgi:hypothetical protein
MTVTYELLEEYTGSRSQEMPDPDNEGESISTSVDCSDIKVRFTSAAPAATHERTVNVCFDDAGAYDAAATLVRIGEVGAGVQHKIAVGVIN